MLVELHTVIETVRDPVHLPVVVFGVGGLLLGVGAAAWCNYFYGTVFSSSVICFVTPLLFLAYLLSMNFGPEFDSQPFLRSFKDQIWLAVIGIMTAIVVLCAIAVAVSTRLGQLMTLVTTVGLFILPPVGLDLRRNISRGAATLARNQGLVTQEESTRVIPGEIRDHPHHRRPHRPPDGGPRSPAASRNGPSWRPALPNFQVLWLSDA